MEEEYGDFEDGTTDDFGEFGADAGEDWGDFISEAPTVETHSVSIESTKPDGSMIGAVFAALQDHSVADGVDSLLKCCNTILVDVFPRDTPESAGTANSSDAYHQPLIASANRAQLAILGDDSMYSAERWQAEMFRVPGARALCDSVLKESRRLFGLPGDDESLTPEPQVLVCRRSMSGRRLSLNLGLLDGNDAPLIKKQLKRCVSIHGNIRQIRTLEAMGVDVTGMEEVSGKRMSWADDPNAHRRNAELSQLSLDDLRVLLAETQNKAADALQRNQEALSTKSVLAHEARVKQDLVPALLQMIQHEKGSRHHEPAGSLSPHGSLRLGSPTKKATQADTQIQIAKFFRRGRKNSNGQGLAKRGHSDTDIVSGLKTGAAGGPMKIDIFAGEVTSIPWREGSDIESLVQLKRLIEAVLANKAEARELLADYVTTL